MRYQSVNALLMGEKRIVELDSLRGIAAFTVLINHCIMAYPIIYSLFVSRDLTKSNLFLNYLMFSPLHIFWNGHSAVILFFILSGFVLSTSHYSTTKFVYKDYLIRRLCRLYLPYFCIITVSVLLLNFYHTHHGMVNLSDWFNTMWYSKVSLTDYFRLILLGGNTNNVGTTLWTIIIEIEVSIILPIFLILIKNISFFQNILFVFAYVLIFLLLNKTVVFTYLPFLRNFYYLTFFLLGGIIYKYKGEITEISVRNKYAPLLIFILILIFYNWEWLFIWVQPYSGGFLHMINDYIAAAGGVLLIIICLVNNSTIKKIFNNVVLKFLGKISYSLYLIHPIILLMVVYTAPTINYGFLIIIVIALSIIISYLYYISIERPAIKLGKYIAGST